MLNNKINKNKVSTKLLFISTNAIGDTYLTLSGSQHISDLINCESDFLISKNSEFLFTKGVNHKKIYSVEKKSVRCLYSILSDLNGKKYDIAISFFPGLFNSLILKYVDADIKTGFVNLVRKSEWYDSPQKLWWKSSLDDTENNYLETKDSQLTNNMERNFKEDVIYWKPEMNYLDRLKLIIEKIGLPIHNLKKYEYCASEHKSEKPFIVCNFDSRIRAKMLDTSRSIKVLEMVLNRTDFNIILIDVNDRYRKSINELGYNLSNRIKIIDGSNFSETLSFIKGCILFAGVDSFPMHIADSYGKKIISVVFRNYSESAFQSLNNVKIIKGNSRSSELVEIIFNTINNI